VFGSARPVVIASLSGLSSINIKLQNSTSAHQSHPTRHHISLRSPESNRIAETPLNLCTKVYESIHMPYTKTTITRLYHHHSEPFTMCFRSEPSRKYYYHEEYIPVRQHHGHHQHHHHHPRASTPARVSYPHVGTSSYRHSGPVVYEQRSSQTRYR
jgi:hypothetical protein